MEERHHAKDYAAMFRHVAILASHKEREHDMRIPTKYKQDDRLAVLSKRIRR